MQVSVDISSEMEQTLSFLSLQSKQSSSELISKALKNALEDLKDYHTAIKAKEEFVESGRVSKSWDEMKKELKL